MIHLKVKAKSGLHAGAVWRLDHSLLSLGAHSKADVFLCDPEIPDTLINFRKIGRRFHIDSKHPDVRLTAPDQRKIDDTIFPSQVLILDFRHIQLELEVVTSTSNFLSSFSDSFHRGAHGTAQLLRGIGARAIVALLFVIGLMLTTLILFFGTAGAVQSQASTIKHAPVEKARVKPLEDLSTRMAESVASELTQFGEKVSPDQFMVKQEKNQVRVSTELSRAQSVKFETLLERLAEDYGQKVNIKAQLKLTREQLAVDGIQIRQVVLGQRSAVVLNDGQRLYVGGRYKGVSVESIDSDRVIFQGKAKYEVLL
ncbi:MAG TPA: EscD/YscD/HrpQ family type III secretion system periplasmic domain-containing protein [Limnobacter sp.]|uniref:EscD/YscD/HrpQ family type III secretion system periplasmic domain-containing protein n=1 Tax=Limnobacter sp. TaxID=2003368 RepID=UPI002E2EB043|nr:EscD/YscD/HrpQ family type III secretion system periplasmic domain-containing protein [Limnobacter sp.]HEX5487453.1 EscD/YscD/HrpQ family type III secretion system periplasmic domain-containing protein [Limnobacter sp.]